MSSPSPDSGDPVTATPTQLTEVEQPAPGVIARDGAVRALTLALEHRWPHEDTTTLERVAAHTVDTALDVGPEAWVMLIAGDSNSEQSLADAVLRTSPEYQGQIPDAVDLKAAAQVIEHLLRR